MCQVTIPAQPPSPMHSLTDVAVATPYRLFRESSHQDWVSRMGTEGRKYAMLSCSRICLPNSCTSVALGGQLQRSGLLLWLSMRTHHLVVRQQAADSSPCNRVGHLEGAMSMQCIQQNVMISG